MREQHVPAACDVAHIGQKLAMICNTVDEVNTIQSGNLLSIKLSLDGLSETSSNCVNCEKIRQFESKLNMLDFVLFTITGLFSSPRSEPG